MAANGNYTLANSSTLINKSTWPVSFTNATPKTSKYNRILSAILQEQNSTINGEKSTVSKLENKTEFTGVKEQHSGQRKLALAVPLVILGVFLALVVLCHIIDITRTRRADKKQKQKKSFKICRVPETEQALEELPNDANNVLLREPQRLAMRNLGTTNFGLCEDIGNGRCMCKLDRCAHCLGYEAKKLQWKDLVYNHQKKTAENSDCRNASTQTRMPVHRILEKVPQSSHKEDSRMPQKIASFNGGYCAEHDSVFDSEVSSKPHFPSSASNYTDSKTSDLLSSIKEVAGSFYYSAASSQNVSTFYDVCVAGPSKDKKQKAKHCKQKISKKQYLSEAELLSGDEDWI